MPLQLDPSPIAVFAPKHSGPAKVALYDEPLCFIEEFLAPEKAQATLIVDRAMDSGSHLLSMFEGLVRIPRNVRWVVAHGLECGALIAARMKDVDQLWRRKQRCGLSGLLT